MQWVGIFTTESHSHGDFVSIFNKKPDSCSALQLETCLDLFTKEETLDRDESPVSLAKCYADTLFSMLEWSTHT